MNDAQPELEPIRSVDLGDVGAFLNTHLNPRLSGDQWAAAVTPTWSVDTPNHGFLLRQDGRIVGVHLAYYSTRLIDGREHRFCNLAAWCVLEDQRHHGIRLLRALLGQRGYTFTDLSPSGNVVELNRRLKFSPLDTTTSLVINTPWPARGRVRVTSDRERIRDLLGADERRLFDDHQGAAAVIHLAASLSDDVCYVMARRVTRKRLPIFGALLHVSDHELFERLQGSVYAHLLRSHHLPVTLVEHRVSGSRPPHGRLLTTTRPKFFRSKDLTADQVDDLYSELTCVRW